MGESFKSLCSTHPLMHLSSVVSSRFLGQVELDFGLRHSLKWEVGCAPHHPRKIPERLDTSLSHNSLSLSSWLLTFTSCTLWTTAIVPSCLYKPACGGGMKVLPPTPSWSTCSNWGGGGGEWRVATQLLFSLLCLDSVLSARKGVLHLHLLCGCGWRWSQISPQFVPLISTPTFGDSCALGQRVHRAEAHTRVYRHSPRSGTVCGNTYSTALSQC